MIGLVASGKANQQSTLEPAPPPSPRSRTNLVASFNEGVEQYERLVFEAGRGHPALSPFVRRLHGVAEPSPVEPVSRDDHGDDDR